MADNYFIFRNRGMYAPNGIIGSTHANSVKQAAKQCDKDPNCVAFVWNKGVDKLSWRAACSHYAVDDVIKMTEGPAKPESITGFRKSKVDKDTYACSVEEANTTLAMDDPDYYIFEQGMKCSKGVIDSHDADTLAEAKAWCTADARCAAFVWNKESKKVWRCACTDFNSNDVYKMHFDKMKTHYTGFKKGYVNIGERKCLEPEQRTEPASKIAPTPVQTPPAQTPPAQTPPAQTPPAQTPPAQFPPAQTPPAQTQGQPAQTQQEGMPIGSIIGLFVLGIVVVVLLIVLIVYLSKRN
jgi:cell division septation protein DedD